jgi:hypothetical protein
MKKIVFLFALLYAGMVQAQEVPRFSKYDIGESGCKIYLPADPGEFELTYSEDLSEVYTGESEHGGFNFAVICVRLKEPLGTTETDKELNADMLEAYMDFLKGQFEISGAAGYGRGHVLESNPDATGVIDYWEGEDGTQYAVKGWVDNETIAVLMLYGSEEYPIYNAQQMFLDGFRFPEE